MRDGYIKLHRKILDNPISKKSDYAWLWTVLLLKANHKETKFVFNNETLILKPGQLLTGRKKLASETGINESQIYKILNFLEKEHQIEQQKTNKFTVITVLKWANYQGDKTKKEQQKEQPSNNQVTTKEQQSNTYKNDKNVKNDKNTYKSEKNKDKKKKKEKKKTIPYKEIIEIYNNICKSLPQVQVLSESRKTLIRCRFNKYGIDKLKKVFEKAEASTFLTNKDGDSDRNWNATFDWLLNENNMIKVLEGNYNNKQGGVRYKHYEG